MSKSKDYQSNYLVLFTLFQLAYLYYSQSRSEIALVLALLSIVAQTIISARMLNQPLVDSVSFRQFLLINSILMLTFPIFFSYQFVQGLWDAFLSSYGLNPHLLSAIDPQIGRGVTSILYSMLENKTRPSNLAPAIQIILQPFYVLYSNTNFLTVLLAFKLFLLSFAGFIWYRFRNISNCTRIFVLPALWLLGFSQANPELLGLLLFIWGYLSISEFNDTTLGLAILGIVSLFGLPYFLLSLCIIHHYKLSKSIWVFGISLLVWLAIPFNFEALFHWAFFSDWTSTFIFYVMNPQINVIWISTLSISMIALGFIAVTLTKKATIKLVFVLLIMMLSPMGTQTLFGTTAANLFFSAETQGIRQIDYALQISLAVYTMLLIGL